MGIPVKCPNGHEFSVKEKYAGKKGICPFCKGKDVVVRVPDSLSSKEITKAFAEAIAEETLRGVKPPSLSDSSIFDDPNDQGPGASSNSHLSSSVVRHNVRCRCGESVPMWFAKCPKCGKFIEHR